MHSIYIRVVAGLAVCFWACGPLWAAESEPAWLAPAIGPFSPSVHFNGAVGDSSGDVEDLAVGHHDPSREDGSVQGLELGVSLRLGQLEGFATYVLAYGAEEEWEDEWEEAFLKVRDLPGGFEVRGGRMLGRYGKFNAQHLHAWNFVDMPLVIGRFLGEHGLWFDGGDITWLKLDVATTLGLTVAYGEAVGHDHEHYEGEDHDGDHEEGHAEDIAYVDGVASGRFFAQFRRDDYQMYEAGVSLAVGDEEAGRQVLVYGLDLTYTWREKGLEPGGRALVWTTELLYRDVESGGPGHDADAHEEEDGVHHDEEDAHDLAHDALPGGAEFGFYSEAVYTLNRALDLGARVGYVEGNHDLESEKRFRLSPAITTYLDPYRRAYVRLQYNYDDFSGGVDEHTVWLQLGLSWGGAEVR